MLDITHSTVSPASRFPLSHCQSSTHADFKDGRSHGDLIMAGTTFPDPFVIQPLSGHTRTAILLHGLGGNGETFGSEL